MYALFSLCFFKGWIGSRARNGINTSIACSIDHVSNISLRKLNLIKKIDTTFKNSVYHPQSMYSSRPIQPSHFKADLIWCEGTFNACWKCSKNNKSISLPRIFLWFWRRGSSALPACLRHNPSLPTPKTQLGIAPTPKLNI